MAKRIKTKRARSGKRKIYTDLSPEEISERERREKRRRIRRRKRKAMSTLLLFLVLLALIFIFVHRKKSQESDEGGTSIAQTDSGLMAVGEAGASMTESTGAAQPAETVSEDMVLPQAGGYEGAVDPLSVITPSAPVDVTRGRAAVDLTQIEGGGYKKVQSAKAAMATSAYFTGTTDTVNTCLQRYGEGEWHAIRDVMGEICVFFEGVHIRKRTYQTGEVTENLERSEEVPFRVVFTVYDDGSFMVTEVSEGDEGVDDWEAWLKALL